MKLWVRISIAVSMLSFVTIVIFTLITTKHVVKTAHESQDRWAELFSKSISQLIVGHTIEGNVKETNDLLSKIIKGSDELDYIMVVGFDDNIFASTLQSSRLPEEITNQDHSKCLDGPSHYELPSHSHRENYINNNKISDVVFPLIKNLNSHLHVGIKTDSLNASINNHIYFAIVLAVVVSVVGLFVSFIVGKKISQPLETLSNIVTGFGKGNEQDTSRINTSNKEILELVKSFERMFRERKKFEKELLDHKNQLENVIKERTAKLELEIIKHEETGKELLSAKFQAENSNKAKSEFLSHMSHEFRTPLNAILGFGQLLMFEEDKDITINAEMIVAAGNHLLTLVNEILDLTKIESGNLEMSIEVVNWFNVVNECLILVRPLAKDKNVEIIFDCNEIFYVSADRVRVKQATLNILSNAVKYNIDGGSVTIDFEVSDDILKLKIKDTGIGIAENKRESVFTPFERMGAEYSGVDGVGIGLVITEALIENMKGKIDFKSELEVGSEFIIELPYLGREKNLAANETEHNVSNNTKKLKTLFPITEQITILYIEDNPANLTVVKAILGKFDNIELIYSYTPTKGLLLANDKIPDLILLDINLPEMDGYAVKLKLAENEKTKNIKVIAVSAHAMPYDIEKAKEYGFADYVAKPFKIETLLKTISNVLKS